MNTELLAVSEELVKNAIIWWHSKRPKNWDEQRHLNNPGINCTNDKELDVALSVCKLVKAYKAHKQDHFIFELPIEGGADPHPETP